MITGKDCIGVRGFDLASETTVARKPFEKYDKEETRFMGELKFLGERIPSSRRFLVLVKRGEEVT